MKYVSQVLNTSFNALLQLDAVSQQRLRKLDGIVVAIEFLPFQYTLQMLVKEDGLYVQEEAALTPDVTIRATPLQLATFAFNDMDVEGDATLAQDVLHLFSHLHIDWEELLSNVIGDAASYHMGQFARRTRRWLRSVDQSITENISEYVHEETQWFPSRAALQDFFDDIDTLRLDVDRLEAKLDRYKV